MAASASLAVAVLLERGRRITFVSALDWPGWCRGARDEGQALGSLEAYADRYRGVAVRAGLDFPSGFRFEVLESVTGNATTDFGVPAIPGHAESDPLELGQGQRLANLVEAAWGLLEEIAAAAPAELRKGPRGGGRNTAQILEHVREAEGDYFRKVGIREKEWSARRGLFAAALRAGGTSGGAWPLAYAARRTGYHVLDHLWEIEDRSLPA